jgi:hypothetical protein
MKISPEFSAVIVVEERETPAGDSGCMETPQAHSAEEAPYRPAVSGEYLPRKSTTLFNRNPYFQGSQVER